MQHFYYFVLGAKAIYIYAGLIKNNLQWNLLLFKNIPKLSPSVLLFMQWITLEVSSSSFLPTIFLSIFKPHFFQAHSNTHMLHDTFVSIYTDVFTLLTSQNLDEQLIINF